MVPVPIVHKDIDSRSQGGVYFARDYNRVVFGLISPLRDEGLVVSFLFGNGIIHILPFSIAVWEYA